MLYWAGTLSSHALGGLSPFALRLPNALAAIALVLVTYAGASRWFGPRAGLWAGFTLLTFLQFVTQAIGYRPDVLFSLAIAAGLLVYAEGTGERPRWLLRVAGFALFGAAMLAKGPLGLLLPGLVLTLWHGTRREWRRLVELGPLSLVALAVYLPWFVACAQAMGSDNILYELYAQNIERFYSGARGHGKPIYYYLANFWADLWPWSGLLPFAIVWAWRSPLRQDRNVQLFLWWFVAFFGFLSLAVTKRQLYLLPAYPAVALLLAPYLDALTRAGAQDDDAPNPRPARAYAAVVVAVLAVIGAGSIAAVVAFESIVPRLDLNTGSTEAAFAVRVPLVITGLVVLAGALWIALAWHKGDVRAGLVRLGVAQIPIYIAIHALILPAMNPARTLKPQGAWVRQQIGDETHIGLVYPRYSVRKMGAWALYSDSLVDILKTREDVERFLAERPGSVVLIEIEAAKELFAGEESRWRARVIGEQESPRTRFLVVR
jgi:4-amino-4-deoxy-L-arabinose transferase-like glycosyltransferase